jgi:hypothetical protein
MHEEYEGRVKYEFFEEKRLFSVKMTVFLLLRELRALHGYIKGRRN